MRTKRKTIAGKGGSTSLVRQAMRDRTGLEIEKRVSKVRGYITYRRRGMHETRLSGIRLSGVVEVRILRDDWEGERGSVRAMF
jgi:hypothetical protein